VSFSCTQDFSAYSALSLFVAVDSSGALAYHDGRLNDRFGEDSIYWDGFMPLGELRIPLSYFNKANLSTATELLIELNQTDTGAIMLSGIYLSRG